jgi:hypothetical protein
LVLVLAKVIEAAPDENHRNALRAKIHQHLKRIEKGDRGLHWRTVSWLLIAPNTFCEVVLPLPMGTLITGTLTLIPLDCASSRHGYQHF